MFGGSDFSDKLLGNPKDALERMAALIQRLNHTSSRNYLAEVYWLQGRALLAIAEIEPARESFMAAKAAAEVNNERNILWQILADLAQVEMTVGAPDAAEHLREQAREIIAYIVDHTGSEELRASFLALSEVQRLSEIGDGRWLWSRL